jgi:hypothetical protein
VANVSCSKGAARLHRPPSGRPRAAAAAAAAAAHPGAAAAARSPKQQQQPQAAAAAAAAAHLEGRAAQVQRAHADLVRAPVALVLGGPTIPSHPRRAGPALAARHSPRAAGRAVRRARRRALLSRRRAARQLLLQRPRLLQQALRIVEGHPAVHALLRAADGARPGGLGAEARICCRAGVGLGWVGLGWVGVGLQWLGAGAGMAGGRRGRRMQGRWEGGTVGCAPPRHAAPATRCTSASSSCRTDSGRRLRPAVAAMNSGVLGRAARGTTACAQCSSGPSACRSRPAGSPANLSSPGCVSTRLYMPVRACVYVGGGTSARPGGWEVGVQRQARAGGGGSRRGSGGPFPGACLGPLAERVAPPARRAGLELWQQCRRPPGAPRTFAQLAGHLVGRCIWADGLYCGQALSGLHPPRVGVAAAAAGGRVERERERESESVPQGCRPRGGGGRAAVGLAGLLTRRVWVCCLLQGGWLRCAACGAGAGARHRLALACPDSHARARAAAVHHQHVARGVVLAGAQP